MAQLPVIEEPHGELQEAIGGSKEARGHHQAIDVIRFFKEKYIILM